MGANIVAWINWQLDPAFMASHFMTSLSHIRNGRWYTIVTACFSHRDPLHLLGNMITLYFFWNRAFSGRLVGFRLLLAVLTLWCCGRCIVVPCACTSPTTRC